MSGSSADHAVDGGATAAGGRGEELGARGEGSDIVAVQRQQRGEAVANGGIAVDHANLQG